jgi:hypothetical protein
VNRDPYIKGEAAKQRVRFIRRCRGCTRDFTDTVGSCSDGYCRLCEDEPSTGYAPAYDYSDNYFQNTPDPVPLRAPGEYTPACRSDILLTAIRQQPGEWTDSRVTEFYLRRLLAIPGALSGVPLCDLASADLNRLAECGQLAPKRRGDRRFYVLAPVHAAPEEAQS